MTMLIITTGGTIDSAPYPDSGAPVNIIPSLEYLAIRKLRELAADVVPPLDLDWIELSNKDSKDFNEEDQAALFELVLKNAGQYERIIVTIGTDRMTNIATDLKRKLPVQPECPIVFTGAIWPLANGEKSDGSANLRLALLKAPSAVSDVYIAMHGHFEPCEKLRKDPVLKQFVLID